MNKNQKSGRRKWLYVMCFVIGFITVMPFLAIATMLGTLDEIWKETGRKSDTKMEYFVSHFVGGARDKLLAAGADLDTWYIRPLTAIDRWAYDRAIQKIPEDDFERLYWYMQSFVWPILSLKQEYQVKQLPMILPDIIQKLANLDSFNITNDEDRDIELHKFVDLNASLFLGYAEEYAPDLYEPNVGIILKRLCDSSVAIHPGKIKSRQMDSFKVSLLRMLTNSYVRTSNHAFHKNGSCDEVIARCWMKISDRIKPIFIDDKDLAQFYSENKQPYPGHENVSDRYQQFLKYYDHKDMPMRQKVRENCKID